MAIASSGAISISDISSEFGGSGARSLSDYYAGAGLVAYLLTDTSGNALPSSGTIKFSDFYTLTKFVAQSFTTLSPGTTTSTVPTGANAIHVQFAVGGGGGGNIGDSYDKAGGESAGAGGGSGAYISDKVFAVTAGETLTFVVGASGAGLNPSTLVAQNPGQFLANINKTASSGGTTSCSGSSTGAVFTLTGGGGGSSSGGGVQGPLRSNSAGSAGSVSHIDTGLTGTFTNASNAGANMTTLTSGPTGSFNDSGSGAAGTNGANCSGDNCRIDGKSGGSSYNGNVSGGTGGSSSGSGTAGSAGTRGSGGGGSGAQTSSTLGTQNSGAGGAGEIKFRFIRRNA